VDCAGFDDSKPTNEYPNQALLAQMIRKARSVQIVLAVTADSLTADRGKLFFKLLTTISRLVSAEGADNLDKFLVPLLLQPMSPPQRNMGEL
jgi:hypothetical protein